MEKWKELESGRVNLSKYISLVELGMEGRGIRKETRDASFEMFQYYRF